MLQNFVTPLIRLKDIIQTRWQLLAGTHKDGDNWQFILYLISREYKYRSFSKQAITIINIYSSIKLNLY